MSSLQKNVAGQNIGFQINSATTGAGITGGVSGNVVIDGGAQAACTGTFTGKGGGQWNYAPTQAETNGTEVSFQFNATGAVSVGLTFYTDPAGGGVNVTQWGGTSVGAVPPDDYINRANTAQGGGSASITLDAGASATDNLYRQQTVYIKSGTGAGQSATITAYVGSTKVAIVDSNWATVPDATSVFRVYSIGPSDTGGGLIPNVNVLQWNSSNVATPSVAGVPITDPHYFNGTASAGVAGYVAPDWSHVNAPTSTVALTNTTISTSQVVASVTGAVGSVTGLTPATIATGVWQDATGTDFTTAGSIGKGLFTSGVVPGAAGGLFIAGSNAATTVNITGNLSGSVGSVTGAVGSVTGAVGSVTGNVGGSVASVTGNVGGNVVGSVGSVTGLTPATIATGVWQDATGTDFTTASSIGKSLYTSGVVPGAAGGLFIAGSNAATTVNITGNITGNLTGSVGSVTGSVGSVTGAVGSVTGNVGGNVVGSVASVTGAVGSVTGNVGGSVASVTGNVGGNVVGSVGSISGVTFPANFALLSIDGTGTVKITSNIKQNVALSGYMFIMTDSTTHGPKAGLGATIAAVYYQDGVSIGATTNTAFELSNGWYAINLTAGEMNAKKIALNFQAAASDPLNVEIVTQP